MEDIPACLHNATLVLWCWDYSNATGGVAVLVRRSDAPRAWFILASQPTPSQWKPSPWPCPKCQAEIDGMWRVCWSCGTAQDGTEDPHFFSTPGVMRHSSGPRNGGASVLLTALVVTVLILSLGLIPAVAIAFLLALVRSVFRRDAEWNNGRDVSDDISGQGIPTTAEAAAEEASDETSRMIERAWRAAVFAVSFPPLALYSFWLLCRFLLSTSRMEPRETFRYIIAWLFTFGGLPWGLLYLLAVVGAFIVIAYQALVMLGSIFDGIFS
jgi:hypothetical protein